MVRGPSENEIVSLYDASFYEDETTVARESAEATLPIIFSLIPVHTVIDIGCGTGAWVAETQKLGCVAIGVDHHVPIEMLTIPINTYIDCDLTNGWPCGGYDLAICLEVAEHLPEESAIPLINGLTRATSVLFSAATPGQQGVGHINCQPHTYWHDLFLTHGFQWDHIGPTLPETVASFYRRNIYLYTRSPE